MLEMKKQKQNWIPIKNTIRDKRIILVDDSIVRGHTNFKPDKKTKGVRC